MFSHHKVSDSIIYFSRDHSRNVEQKKNIYIDEKNACDSLVERPRLIFRSFYSKGDETIDRDTIEKCFVREISSVHEFSHFFIVALDPRRAWIRLRIQAD